MGPASDLYRVLFEQSPDAILVIDPDTLQPTDFNDRALDLLGYSREEFRTLRLTDYEAVDSAAQVRGRMDRLRDQAVDALQTRWRTKAGELRDIQLSVRPVSLESRQYFQLVARDITPQKETEAALRASEQRYRTIVESQLEFVDRYLPGGVLTYVNPALCRYVGLPAEELLGRSFFPFIHEADREAVICLVESLTAAQPTAEIESRVVLPDGRVRWHLWNYCGIFDEDGGLVEYQSVGRDITARKEAMRQLSLTAFALDQVQEEAILVDDQARILYANRQACSALGYRREELLGLTVSDFDPGMAVENVRTFIEELQQQGTSTFESTHRTRDGQRYPVEVTANYFQWEGGDYVVGLARDITERRRSEEQLRQSEERYRLLFENMAKGVFCRRADGTMDEVNQAALDMFGLTREEFLNRSAGDPRWQAMDEDGREYAPGDGPSSRALRTGIPVRNAVYGVFNPRRQDHVWLSIDAIPLLRHGEEHPWQVMVTLMDITERRREAQRLRLLNDCFIGFTPDAGANINRITTAVGQMMGADCALYNRLEGEMLCSVGQWQTPPDYRELDRAQGHLCHDVICGEGAQPLVVRDLAHSPYAESDPNVRSFGLATYVGMPVFWGGEAVGSLCVVYTRDIQPDEADLSLMKIAASAVAVEEARWRSEQALTRREAFISAILDSVDEGFLVIDRDFRILTANRTFRQAMGCETENIVGRTCHEITHRTSRPCHEVGEECAVRGVFATGTAQTRLHRHQGQDGTLRYIQLKAYPLRDEAGAVTSAIEMALDVTAQRQLAEEQAKSQKLEALGTLAGGIAHDFNNLLQGVFGYLSLARIHLGNQERAADLLEQAEKALGQSINLTGQLLTFAKGGQPVIGCYDLEPILREAARFALSGTRSDFRLAVEGPLWPVAADQGQIGQVIQNVVINANEAMPEGGVVNVRLENLALEPGNHSRLPEGGHFVRITIRDTGIGIQPGHLERIFDPYFTTKQRGSGLGLATAYSIVNNHQGLIEVDSTPGQGSRFCIYLPACEETPEAEVSVVSSATPRVGRILVMDDEEVVRAVAGEMLEALGHEVVLTADGKEALQRYREAQEQGRAFDVVILDLTVKGGMGGAETIRALQQMDPDVTAVVSTGYAENDVVAEYRAYGFVAALNKPYRIDRLQEVLDRLLGAEPNPPGAT